jgi:hypothetical protein
MMSGFNDVEQALPGKLSNTKYVRTIHLHAVAVGVTTFSVVFKKDSSSG